MNFEISTKNLVTPDCGQLTQDGNFFVQIWKATELIDFEITFGKRAVEMEIGNQTGRRLISLCNLLHLQMADFTTFAICQLKLFLGEKNKFIKETVREVLGFKEKAIRNVWSHTM